MARFSSDDKKLFGASLALAGGQTAQGVISGRQEAKFNKRVNRLGFETQFNQASQSLSQLELREAEERAAAERQIRQITSRAREATGAIRAQAAESSTAGASVLAAVQAFERRELEAINATRRSQEATQGQLRAQRDQVVTELFLARLNASQGASRVPSFVDIAVGLTSAALDSFVRLRGTD